MQYLVESWNNKFFHRLLGLAHLLDGTVEQVEYVIMKTNIKVRWHD